MNLTIYGTGYVGLVTGACLANLGHQVLCIDINKEKIEQLKKAEVPIYEPQLTDLVKKQLALGNLNFSSDFSKGVEHGLAQFICVNTPQNKDGSADISRILNVAQSIASLMQEYRLIINKSTAPVGTVAKIQEIMHEKCKSLQKELNFDVAANPEFLKEGSAIEDFLNPDRIIIGVQNEKALAYLKEIYASFMSEEKLLCMNITSAEFTKYVANAMLATKISFMNEMANLADCLGADIEQVRQGIAKDTRIGPYFIAAGCGYGGSCFPKDIKALIHCAKEEDTDLLLLKAVDEVNSSQKQVLFKKIHQHFQGELTHLNFAVWGLSFKPNTDDIREASSKVLLEALWQKGAFVKAYDPVAMPAMAKYYENQQNLMLCESAKACLDNADALIILTEWPEFINADLALIKNSLKQPLIFDGRNIFNLHNIKEQGFIYYGIGRRHKPKAVTF